MILLLSYTLSNAQIKNAKTESVKIYGNCEMCKSAIEKAGNVKHISKVEWRQDTKTADLTYDANKTNQSEILKRIALAGYGSDSFLAPDDVYNGLPECCQYNRINKSVAKVEVTEGHSFDIHNVADVEPPMKQEVNQADVIFNHYFYLKDALVGSDGNLASSYAKELLIAINALEMDKLSHNEHGVWMSIKELLSTEADHIAETKDVEQQRNYFISLSEYMYKLVKVSKLDEPVYYQHCPMANEGNGANWLSKENAVKNPYYGSKMLTCGKIVETIK